jgi:hypothetical protein
METDGLFSKLRSMRMIVLFLALLLAYGAVSYSPHAATPNNLHSIDLGGVTGATNNTILAYGRYVLIAPFWPSTGIAENGDIDPSLLDNDSVYMIDTKKPDAPPIRKRLSSRDSKLGPNTVYFPSRIAFDENSNNLYVRGTRFEENDGITKVVDAIAYVRLVPDDKGKAEFDGKVVTFDIEGVPGAETGEAPLDFAFSAHGILVFTNGASVFSFTLAEGYLNRVDIVQADEYNSNNSVSFLDVDPATNIVSVCANQKWEGKDKVTRVSSQLSFYKLGEFGTFDLLKRTEFGRSSDGKALVDGGNIEIVSDADSQFALFATNDGSVYTVDLSSAGETATMTRLFSFPELALGSATDSNPLLVHYEPAKRIVGIVKPGFTVQISRPANGRPGRISRPANLHITSETAVLAMAKLGKKNKVTSAVSFAEDFKDEGGLANLAIGEDSQWLISTYSGKLYSIEVDGDLQDSELNLLGTIGSRVDRFAYYADRTSVVAISAFTLDEDGMRIASPGSLVFGKLSDLESQPGSIVQALLPTASLLGKSTPTIRRPCNIRR